MIKQAMQQAYTTASIEQGGEVASYIPELANVDVSKFAAAVQMIDGALLTEGPAEEFVYTVQSCGKLIVLIGLLEEFGYEAVFSWIGREASGAAFNAVSKLEHEFARPANPMINAGAIALCSRIPGTTIQRADWLDKWVLKLFNASLTVNKAVYASERATSHRNCSIAHLLKGNDLLPLSVDDTLETYYRLCSYDTNTMQASFLPMLLANSGRDTNGQQVISASTCKLVVSIMATCGLYDESGRYLVLTGMPAKSGVSGLMMAVATGRAGIAVCSPLLNKKGGSVRGHAFLQQLSRTLSWHFAIPC